MGQTNSTAHRLADPAAVGHIRRQSEPDGQPTDHREQGTNTFRRTAKKTLDPKRVIAGQQIYQQQTCARCHSIAGQGNPRNPLDGAGARLSATELREWIIGADTLQDKLPGYAFRSKQKYKELPESDLDALVSYIQSLRQEKP